MAFWETLLATLFGAAIGAAGSIIAGILAVNRQLRGQAEQARLEPGRNDVFISYAWEDQDFVRRLHDALAERGRQSWVDWEGIPPTAEWMAEVKGAIEATDSFVFVVSPASVTSRVCKEEAEHAAAEKKRIVPLVRSEVEGDVPEPVAAHNWIFFPDATSGSTPVQCEFRAPHGPQATKPEPTILRKAPISEFRSLRSRSCLPPPFLLALVQTKLSDTQADR